VAEKYPSLSSSTNAATKVILTRAGQYQRQEIVRRCWEGAVRGGYVGHGETYSMSARSCGGPRAVPGRRFGRTDRFLLQITADAPAARWSRCPATGMSGGRRTGLPDCVLRLGRPGTATSRRRGKASGSSMSSIPEYDDCPGSRASSPGPSGLTCPGASSWRSGSLRRRPSRVFRLVSCHDLACR